MGGGRVRRSGGLRVLSPYHWNKSLLSLSPERFVYVENIFEYFKEIILVSLPTQASIVVI